MLGNEAKIIRAERAAMQGFARRASSCMQILHSSMHNQYDLSAEQAYEYCVRYTIAMLAVLIAADKASSQENSCTYIRDAADAIRAAANEKSYGRHKAFLESLAKLYQLNGIEMFINGLDIHPKEGAFNLAASALVGVDNDSNFNEIYYQSIPLNWLGRAYQHLLTLKPSKEGKLEITKTRRKGSGIYFTPPPLVKYITEKVIGTLVDSLPGDLHPDMSLNSSNNIRLIDPSMGGGDFLIRSIEAFSKNTSAFHLKQSNELKRHIAGNCIYGLDIDPIAVEISRFCVWAASGFADEITHKIKSHLICADALGSGNSSSFDWAKTFPEIFNGHNPGFDAVIGNPPYIASKNGFSPANRFGQMDTYLMFLLSILDNQLVRQNGLLSMVLPDPMLVRENAAPVRKKIFDDWTILSILHISGAFPEAQVANIVPICRRSSKKTDTFSVTRIELAADRHRFSLRPAQTAKELSREVHINTILSQKRCEILYMLEGGVFGPIMRRIHGNDISLSVYNPPFVPLESLNIKSIYRGEEIGKAAISSKEGEFPILLGGQSIQQYEICWEGNKISRSSIKKPIERYMASKILIQKSSNKIIAAYDNCDDKHSGFVFPQSVYAIELSKNGIHPLYLLCLLNSRVMNEYIYRTVTAYKLLQPQIELEDIRALPIRNIAFTTPQRARKELLDRAIAVFEREINQANIAAPYPELANLAIQCLTGNPERSDVVHDLLVYLGSLLINLIKLNRNSPEIETTRRIEATRAAIETIVWQLYSSEPEQMSLPW